MLSAALDGRRAADLDQVADGKALGDVVAFLLDFFDEFESLGEPVGVLSELVEVEVASRAGVWRVGREG
jgi:hypothetical protein